jgi:hypothetical protein
MVMITTAAMALPDGNVAEDTVVIEFGKTSKMVIYAESVDDLKALGEYDINAMLESLNSSLDSTDTELSELSIVDEEGDKYLKDTTQEDQYVERGSLKYYGDNDSDDKTYRYEKNNDSHWDYDDNDDDEYISRKSKSGGTYSSFAFEFGMNNWLEKGSFPDANNEPYSVKPWGSWYVALGGVNHTNITGALSLDWGGNISWYNWKLEDTSVRIEKTDAGTTFTPDPTISSPKKSKLSATYINAMLVPMIDFSHKRNVKSGRRWSSGKYSRKGFRIGAGMYAGYRVDSWTKMVYKENDSKQKDKYKGNYYLNNFRYGVRTQMGYKGMDFFFNYDLNTVFATGKGPELNAISFGFIL